MTLKTKRFRCANPVHNPPMIEGYHRMSTVGQSVDVQVRQLKAAGARQVVRGAPSGAETGRSQLQKVLAQLDTGRLPTVTRLDCTASSTRELGKALAAIAGNKAGFTSLGDTSADATTAHGSLMLTLLRGLAEFECELIRARIGDGRLVARRVKVGKQLKLTQHKIKEAIKRRELGEATREIARSYDVSHSTITRSSI